MVTFITEKVKLSTSKDGAAHWLATTSVTSDARSTSRVKVDVGGPAPEPLSPMSNGLMDLDNSS